VVSFGPVDFVVHLVQTPDRGRSFPGRSRLLMRAPRRLDPDRAASHMPVLYRAARAWSRSREEAEDLVQETFARVLARPRFLRGDDELGYLLRSMRNTLLSQRRAESRRPRTTVLDDEFGRAGGPGNDPADAVERHQVYAFIYELPEEFRDAIVAVDVVGLSYGEAAEVLGIPEGTLTSRLFRARDRVASRLGPSRTGAPPAERSPAARGERPRGQ
jgi:RNA polymerase sigma-70 factor (ECF subfamily)